MKSAVFISQSIFINKPREKVWDFTQNYDERNKWDKSILEATVLQTGPQRMVRLKTRGNTCMTFIYKLDDRPNKTTLAAKDIKSPFIKSGGGSWTYEDQEEGTLWTQTNTIVFKNHFLLKLFLPLYRYIFRRQTRRAMHRAKKIMEDQVPDEGPKT